MDRKQSLNKQDSGHNEGQHSNIPPKNQPHADNNSQSMDNMMQEGDEQKVSNKQNKESGSGKRYPEQDQPVK